MAKQPKVLDSKDRDDLIQVCAECEQSQELLEALTRAGVDVRKLKERNQAQLHMARQLLREQFTDEPTPIG